MTVASRFYDLRQAYPALGSGVQEDELHAIAAAEGIVIERVRRLPSAGATLNAAGTAVILLRADLEPDQARSTLAHELAHVWLGHGAEPVAERSRISRKRREQELEADSLAHLILNAKLRR